MAERLEEYGQELYAGEAPSAEKECPGQETREYVISVRCDSQTIDGIRRELDRLKVAHSVRELEF